MPKIEEMFAFVTEDSSPDDEGIVAVPYGNEWLPMVGADMKRVESLKPIAQEIATKTGKNIKILHFTQREEIGRIYRRRQK